MDTYTFTVVVDDTDDEFSQDFNCKDIEQTEMFEGSIKDILEDNNYHIISVRLTKVTTTL